MPGEWPPAATLQASGSAWGAIRRAFLQITAHAMPAQYRQLTATPGVRPYSPKARWICNILLVAAASLPGRIECCHLGPFPFPQKEKGSP